MNVVLVVDDVAALAEQYAYDLTRVGGYRTRQAATGPDALRILQTEPVDCVVLDLEMPGMDGFDVLRSLADQAIRVPVIVYTGTGSYDRCVQAVRLGASGFVDKGESMDRVVHEIENALRRHELENEVDGLRRRLGADTPLIGGSAAMRKLADAIGRVAPVPSPVLIFGESGTGKELVARELHRLGAHPTAPFLAVNSAAIPENLVESELFGHERGAFSGADRLKRGAFEAVGKGTLFLDEVGDLAGAAQAKLLRVLEEGEIRRVGATETLPVATRVVAATHRDLEADARAGSFREDLFFRLNVHTLRVPPLRERLSDVPELIQHFLGSISLRLGVPRKVLSENALQALTGCQWRRNNVRELRNVVERTIIASEGPVIRASDVPPEIQPSAGASSSRGRTFRERKADAERLIVVEALEKTGWHVTRTAAELGLADHASLLKIMRRHAIQRPSDD